VTTQAFFSLLSIHKGSKHTEFGPCSFPFVITGLGAPPCGWLATFGHFCEYGVSGRHRWAPALLWVRSPPVAVLPACGSFVPGRVRLRASVCGKQPFPGGSPQPGLPGREGDPGTGAAGMRLRRVPRGHPGHLVEGLLRASGFGPSGRLEMGFLGPLGEL
jgi:hypothetical protein